jgi:hypothetical protein
MCSTKEAISTPKKIFKLIKDECDEFYTTCCNCDMIMPLSAVNKHSGHCIESIDSRLAMTDAKASQLSKLHDIFLSLQQNDEDSIWEELVDVSGRATSALQHNVLKLLLHRITVLNYFRICTQKNELGTRHPCWHIS